MRSVAMPMATASAVMAARALAQAESEPRSMSGVACRTEECKWLPYRQK